MRASRTTRRTGFTLVEMMIALVIFSIVILATASAVDRTQGAWSSTSSSDDLHTRARRTLDRLSQDVATAVRASLAPNSTLPGASTEVLDFQHNTGWAAGAMVAGPLNRLSLELDAGEIDDGLDNDSDGLVDDCVLVWRENPGQPDERRSVRTRWVAEYLEGETPNGADDNGNGLIDERGFCATIAGNTLTLRLTLQRLTPEGQVKTVTAETAVLIRN